MRNEDKTKDQLIKELVELREKLAVLQAEDTQRRQAKRMLEEIEAKFKILTVHAPVGIFLDDAQGNAVYINNKCAELIGLAPEEGLNLDWVPFIHSDDRERVVNKWIEAVKEGKTFHQEYRWVHKDGKVVWTIGQVVPVKLANGEVVGFVGTLVDITDRKKAEEALKKQRDHLEELVQERTAELKAAWVQTESANKAKSAFLANISHELRTPMNAILGYSQLIQREVSLLPEQQEYLRTINRSGEHLLALINDVLEISKIEAGKLAIESATFDLRALLRDLERMFDSSMDTKGLRFEVIGIDSLPQYVTTDENKLRQVLVNLLSNAVKFTEQGGNLAFEPLLNLIEKIEQPEQEKSGD
jgi:PAS domain S-box-containing protein